MPNLTAGQLATLKAAIASESDPVFAQLRDEGATGRMAEWLNAPATPTYSVWSTSVPVSDVNDAIAFDQYTPNSSPDGTALYTNRLLAIQTKQMNLQNMLQGRERIDASKGRIRSGLLDAVTNLPAGTAGALVSAGGPNGERLLNALTRPALRGERVFVTSTATTGTVSAGVLVYQGQITDADVVLALSI